MLVKTDIERYFMAEKSEGLFFLMMGMAAIGLAIIFYFVLKTYFLRGAALPLVVAGLIQTMAGFSVYSNSDSQRISNVYAYDMDPSKLRQEELPRMQSVNRRFVLYRWTEIFLFLTAAGVALYSKSGPGRAYWLGWGLALAFEAAVMLAAGRYAEKRSREYTQKLEKFSPDPFRSII